MNADGLIGEIGFYWNEVNDRLRAIERETVAVAVDALVPLQLSESLAGPRNVGQAVAEYL